MTADKIQRVLRWTFGGHRQSDSMEIVTTLHELAHWFTFYDVDEEMPSLVADMSFDIDQQLNLPATHRHKHRHGRLDGYYTDNWQFGRELLAVAVHNRFHEMDSFAWDETIRSLHRQFPDRSFDDIRSGIRRMTWRKSSAKVYNRLVQWFTNQAEAMEEAESRT